LGVLFAAVTLHPLPVVETVTETVTIVTQAVHQDDHLFVEVDETLDFVEIERQSMCLWHLMVEQEIPITLDNVLTAGAWSDLHGGACALRGEADDAGQ
jgi:hypothetical protein